MVCYGMGGHQLFALTHLLFSTYNIFISASDLLLWFNVLNCNHVVLMRDSCTHAQIWVRDLAVLFGPSGCVRCHGTKCPLLTALFFFSLSAGLLFSQKGDRRVPKFCMGFTQIKMRFGVKKKLGGTPCSKGGQFFRFFFGRMKSA
jgi:hypothetical protein